MQSSSLHGIKIDIYPLWRGRVSPPPGVEKRPRASWAAKAAKHAAVPVAVGLGGA